MFATFPLASETGCYLFFHDEVCVCNLVRQRCCAFLCNYCASMQEHVLVAGVWCVGWVAELKDASFQ